MLNKEVFFKGIEDLVTFFPNWSVKVDSASVTRAWYEMFQKCSDEEFKEIVYGYIAYENFPPTVAGLNKYYVKKNIWKVKNFD